MLGIWQRSCHLHCSLKWYIPNCLFCSWLPWWPSLLKYSLGMVPFCLSLPRFQSHDLAMTIVDKLDATTGFSLTFAAVDLSPPSDWHVFQPVSACVQTRLLRQTCGLCEYHCDVKTKTNKKTVQKVRVTGLNAGGQLTCCPQQYLKDLFDCVVCREGSAVSEWMCFC